MTLVIGVFVSVSAFAQDILVKGHVKDDIGEDVIGASVRVKGTQQGAVTDVNGNFSIKVEKGAKLIISFIGFQSQEVSAAQNMSITLHEDLKLLNETVIIGYGAVKKTDLTGSVTAIKPDSKNHGLETNAQDMLQGKIAGVSVISDGGTPGGGSTIRIRGGSSLNASNDPLIVIDGLAMDSYGVKGLANPLSMVNPADIETFTVLKDASATAIYGSRASNGVIIITTKKGVRGQKPKVTYNGNVSISANRKTLDVLDGPAFTELVRNLYGEDSDAFNALGYTNAEGEKVYANTDWQDEIYRTAVSTDHNITVAGGLDNMPYRVSFGYTNSQGIVETSKFERYTASFNIAPSFLEDHLKLNINGKGMISNNRYADGGAIDAARYMDPTKPVKWDGAGNEFFGGYYQWSSDASKFGDSNWGLAVNDKATQNPVALLNNRDDHATSKTLLGNLEVDYAIHGFEDLHLHANGSFDISTGRQEFENKRTSYSDNYFGRSGWNTGDSYNLQLTTYAQYLKEFNEVHNLNVMAGYEYQRYHNKTDWYAAGVDYVTGEPYNAPDENTVTLYKTENYLLSYFGRLNYTLHDRYLFTFTMRADGSSRFHKDNRWGTFWAIGGSWRLKEEAFLKDVNWLNNLKVKVSYGTQGNDHLLDGDGNDIVHVYSDLYEVNRVDGSAAFSKWLRGNPDLTWEKSRNFNAGFEATIWNRLNIGFDFFIKETRDMLYQSPLAASEGNPSYIWKNEMNMKNTGIEFEISGDIIKTKDITWNASLNLTHYKNELTKLPDSKPADEFPNGYQAGRYWRKLGGSLYDWYRYEYVGVDPTNGLPQYNKYIYKTDENGKYVRDENGDEIIEDVKIVNKTSDATLRQTGKSAIPDLVGGFSTTLNAYGLDLSISTAFQLGGWVLDNNYANLMNSGDNGENFHKDMFNRWTPAHTDTDIPALNFGNQNAGIDASSDYFLVKGNYFSLRNITIGYTFPKKLLASTGITNLRIYLTGDNIWLKSVRKGFDPRYSFNGFNDVASYSALSSYSAGINLSF